MPETRTNGETQREREIIREREAALRKQEFDVLVAKAGIDDQEYARLRVLAHLIGEAYAERIGEMLDAEEGNPAKSRRTLVNGGTREPDSETRRRLRI